MDLSDLKDHKMAVVVLAGVALGGVYLLISRAKATSSSAAASADPTAAANLYGTTDTVYVPTTETTYNFGYGSYNSGSGAFTTSTNSNNTTTTTNNMPTVATPVTTPTAASTSGTPSTATSGGNTTSAYAPIYLSGSNQQTATQTAVSNPGSIVYNNGAQAAVTKATSNGGVVTATGPNAYDQAVDQAGGQYINHVWYSGHYANGSGTDFVTSNPSLQSVYNKVVPKNGK